MTLRGYETTSIGIVGWGGILRLDLGKERKGKEREDNDYGRNGYGVFWKNDTLEDFEPKYCIKLRILFAVPKR